MPMHAERDIVKANLSVRPSVRHTLVLYRNECTYLTLFPPSGRGMTLVFLDPPQLQNSNALSGGVKYKGWENCANIAIYLEHGTR